MTECIGQWTLATLLGLAAVLTGCTSAGTGQSVPGNPLISRELHGVLTCRTMKGGEPCGEDRWFVTIHPDGTRTHRTFVDLPRDQGQIDVVYRGRNDFGFIEAYANSWFRGKPVGSGVYIAEPGKLRIMTAGPKGTATAEMATPPGFSVLLHPVSLDGWHLSHYDEAAAGRQEITMYTFGAGGGSGLARAPMAFEFVGEETLNVPAGRFATRHYRMGKDAEVWISGPDRVVIRHEFRTMDSRFELAELSATRQGPQSHAIP